MHIKGHGDDCADLKELVEGTRANSNNPSAYLVAEQCRINLNENMLILLYLSGNFFRKLWQF